MTNPTYRSGSKTPRQNCTAARIHERMFCATALMSLPCQKVPPHELFLVIILAPFGIQAFTPQPSVEAFRVGILYRLARLNELYPHPVLCSKPLRHDCEILGHYLEPIASGNPLCCCVQFAALSTREVG
jgi:hypothetical protein